MKWKTFILKFLKQISIILFLLTHIGIGNKKMTLFQLE